MPTLSLAQLAEACEGQLLRGNPATPVTNFAMDSRKLAADGGFFALPGGQADGHQFLEHAATAGAVAAVVQHAPAGDRPVPDGLVLVDDTRAALARCGSWVRRHNGGVRWIALSGSNGKTTTKEMIAEGLSAQYRVHRTPGNLNNHLGVPLALLALPEDTEYAVIELGMSGPGEIADLTRLVDPDVGLLTNVRAVHMAFFRTLDDIAAAKGELFATLRDEATAVVNLDDTHVRTQAHRHVGPQVTFGRHPAADVRLEHVDARYLPGASLSFVHASKPWRLQLRLGGAHAAANALAAMATLVAVGCDLGAAAERIERMDAGPGRGRVHRLEGDIVIVDDSYNSSPPALAMVLDTLRASEPAGRRVLIMGDMLELGSMEVTLHREAGRRAAGAGVKLLIAVGALAREAAETARRAGVPEVHHHHDAASAADSVFEFLRPGDLVVVKGSRRIGLERVVQALVAAAPRMH